MTHARKRFRILPVLLALFLVVAGCDSNDNGDDGGNNNPFGNGSVTAQIDGNSFDAEIITSTYVNGVLALGANLGASGVTVQEQINIAIPNATETTYQVALTNPVTITYSTGSLTALEAYVGSSGSITIDELTDEGASGSFEFTGVNNAQETISVTNGQFSVGFTTF